MLTTYRVTARLYFDTPLDFTVALPATHLDTTITVISNSAFVLPSGSFTFNSGEVVTTELSQNIIVGANSIIVSPLLNPLAIGSTTSGYDPVTGNPVEQTISSMVEASLESPYYRAPSDMNLPGQGNMNIQLSGRCISPKYLPKHLLYQHLRCDLQRDENHWITGKLRLDSYSSSRFRLERVFGDYIVGTFQHDSMIVNDLPLPSL